MCVCVCVCAGLEKINLARQWLSLPVSLAGQALQPVKHITMTNTQTHIRQRYKYTNTHATTIQIQKHACDKDTNKETHMRQGYKYTLQIHKYQTCVRHGVCGQHFWANILSIPFTKYMTRCAVHLTYQNHHYGISARYGVASKKC